ncbi:MAG TPA: hypothetical protein VN285_04135 [Candidatus Deferrimicrobium sp.]|nr:hypothetical protein [Candidatus Deferrimicrobium sp.]
MTKLTMNARRLVAAFKLNRRKSEVALETIDFSAVLARPKNILVCLPGSLRQLTIVKQYLPLLTEMFKSADITLLPLPGIKIADIFPRKGFHIMTPTADQLTWSGLAKKSYLKLLQDSKFDVVVDLNLETSLFTSSVLLGIPHAVRVGRASHLGRPYYNLEIKTKYLRDERHIYRSLLETLGVLRNRPGSATALDRKG